MSLTDRNGRRHGYGPPAAAAKAGPPSGSQTRVLRLRSNSAAMTRAIGHRLGELAVDGWVVLLEGQLGAGKTAFAQGLLAGVGVKSQVTSPTFTLVNEYQGRLPVWHADLYRLEDAPREFAAIGGDELLPPPIGLTVVEWADRLGELVPPEYIRIVLCQPPAPRPESPTKPAAENRRELQIEFCGPGLGLAAAAFAATLPSLLAATAPAPPEPSPSPPAPPCGVRRCQDA